MVKTLFLSMLGSGVLFTAFAIGIINFPMAIIGVTAIGILTMRRSCKLDY